MKKISFGNIKLTLESEASKDGSDEVAGFGRFGKVSKQEVSEPGDPSGCTGETSASSSDKKARQFCVEEFVQSSVDRLKLSSSKADSEKNSKDGPDSNLADNPKSSEDEYDIGPPPPADELPPTSSKEQVVNRVGDPLPDTELQDDAPSDDDDDDDDDVDEPDENPISWIPDSLNIDLGHGVKPVTALAVDPAGSRVITGSVDYEVRYWDFNGMTSALRHFRQNQPFGSYPVNDVQYSGSGDRAVLVSGSSRVRLVDRDGVDVLVTKAGDMYIIDMSRTKGHTAAVNAACWHTKNREEFLTCSDDGTLRLWDVETAGACHRALIKPRAAGGLKARPSTCRYSGDGAQVAAGCCDGGIYMWDHRKHFVNTSMMVRDAHVRGHAITRLAFSYDSRQLLSRSNDETLKLWDMRQLKQSLHSAAGLFSNFSGTDCLFSPNDRLVVTATSAERHASGAVHVFNRHDFTPVTRINIPDTHAIRVVWHPRINQLLVGCGSGTCRVFYDASKSHRGALLCSTKKAKAKQMEVMKNTTVITPHALRQFREPRQKSTLKQMQKARKDPVKSHRPDLPQGKSGTGGRVAPGGSTLASYVMRTLGKESKKREEGDPREALLKHAKEAAENPYWVTPAYAKTQPKQIFQSTEEDEPEPKRSRN